MTSVFSLAFLSALHRLTLNLVMDKAGRSATKVASTKDVSNLKNPEAFQVGFVWNSTGSSSDLVMQKSCVSKKIDTM